MTLPEYDPNLEARSNIVTPPDGHVRHYGAYQERWSAMCGEPGATYFASDWRLVNCAECRKPAEPAEDVNKHLRRTTWPELSSGSISAATAAGDALADARAKLHPDQDQITVTGALPDKAEHHWTIADTLLAVAVDALDKAKAELHKAHDELNRPVVVHLAHPTVPGQAAISLGFPAARACDPTQVYDGYPAGTNKIVCSACTFITTNGGTRAAVPYADPNDYPLNRDHPTSLPLAGHISWCMATTPTGEALPLAGPTHHVCRQPHGHFLTALHLCDVCGHTWPVDGPADQVTEPLPTPDRRHVAEKDPVGHPSWCMDTTPTGEAIEFAGATISAYHVCRGLRDHTTDHRCDADDCDQTWPRNTEPDPAPVLDTLVSLVADRPGLYAYTETDPATIPTELPYGVRPRDLATVRLVANWCGNLDPHSHPYQGCDGIEPNTVYIRIPN